MKEFENYEHLVRYTIAEDNAMFLAGRSNGKRKNGNKWYGGQASSSGNGNGHASHSNDSAPMEVDTYEHIPKMTPAIKKWCDDEGRCYFCRRKEGHIAKNCPRKPDNYNPNEKRQ
ncbi:hypothetical protein Ndes2437B_g01097 [Nannochloris sp. 'desiccata']